MLRVGPRKARLTTKQHAAEKETAKRNAKLIQSQKSIHETNVRFAEQNAAAEAANAEMHATLKARERELAAAEAKLAADRKALKDQREALIRKAKLHEAKVSGREEGIKATEQNLQSAFGGLNAIMTGLEDGSVTVADNKLNGRGLGGYLRDAISKDAPQTPGHSLLRRFVSFIIRSWNAIETRDGPEVDQDYRDRPSM